MWSVDKAGGGGGECLGGGCHYGMDVVVYRHISIRLRVNTISMLLQGHMLYLYDCSCCIAESFVLDLMI